MHLSPETNIVKTQDLYVYEVLLFYGHFSEPGILYGSSPSQMMGEIENSETSFRHSQTEI